MAANRTYASRRSPIRNSTAATEASRNTIGSAAAPATRRQRLR
jgi:hypothetical protein